MKSTPDNASSTPDLSGLSTAEMAVVISHLQEQLAARDITGPLKSITLTRTTTGKYFASLLVEDGVDAPAPLQTVESVLGVDMDLTHLAIDSEG